MTGILNLLAGAVSSVIKDTYFNLVTLLLPGDGTNGAQNNTFLDSGTANSGSGFTITRNGNTTQGTFSPFSQTGWSNYFDGTGYLSFANSTDDDIGSGDFTIELWVMYPTIPSAYTALYSKYAASKGVNLQFNGSLLRLCLGNNTTDDLYTFSWTPAANTWYHVAVTRSGTNGRAFVNGSQIGTTQTVITTNAVTTNGVQIGRTHTVTDGIAQYISNVRFVKGQALYTGAFTPATAPLTTTSVGSTGTGAASSITGTVGLLTCQSNRFVDNGTGATTVSVGAATVSVQAFSPFAPTAAYSAATNGGSMYTDGTGDYLSVASNTAFDIMGGSYTIEYWFYPVSVSTAIMVDRQDTSSPFTGYSCRLINSTAQTANLNWDPGSSGSLTTTTTPIKINQWNHIAYTCDGTTLRIYANGKLEASTTTLSSSNYNGALTIGARATNTQPTNAYFSGFILRKGTASYTGSTYTVPTAPPTNITNTSLLLNYTNAGIIDATAKNDLETVGNAQISTTQSKFGGSSMYFDGTGDALIDYDPAYLNSPGSGDWTFETWVYLNALPGAFSALYHLKNDTSTATTVFIIEITSAGKLSLSTGTSLIVDGTSSLITTGSWIHVAVTRSSGTFRTFINGVQDKSVANTTTYNGTYDLFGVWRYSGSDNYLNGYMDDLRITKGYARYTTTFTPPTAAFALQ